MEPDQPWLEMYHHATKNDSSLSAKNDWIVAVNIYHKKVSTQSTYLLNRFINYVFNNELQ